MPSSTTLLKAIRARCVDCCADQPSEVKVCTATDCPSWPHRFGTHTYRVKEDTPDLLNEGRFLARMNSLEAQEGHTDMAKGKGFWTPSCTITSRAPLGGTHGTSETSAAPSGAADSTITAKDGILAVAGLASGDTE